MVFLMQGYRSEAIVLAKGTVDGDMAGKFVRSLLTEPGMVAECEEGWQMWRWFVRSRNGKSEVNKVIVHRESLH